MFGSRTKKIISVQSQAQNLAGPEKDRNSFLKTSIMAAVTNPDPKSYIGEFVTHQYLNGPGIKLRNFSRWTMRTGFTKNVIKQGGGRITLPAKLNPEDIRRAISPTDPESVSLIQYTNDYADDEYWVTQFMLINFPSEINGHWYSSKDSVTGEISITFYEGDLPPLNSEGEPEYPEDFEMVESRVEKFTPSNYDQNGNYIFAMYTTKYSDDDEAIDLGTLVQLGTAPFNKPSAFVDKESDTTVNTTYTLENTKVTDITYDDGRPPETATEVTSRTESPLEVNQVWTKKEYKGEYAGIDEDLTYSEKQYLNLMTTHVVKESSTSNTVVTTIEGGVKKSTTVTNIVENLEVSRSKQLDLQKVDIKGWAVTRMFIYKIGTGTYPQLDKLTGGGGALGEFFPHIPIRLWDKPISPTSNGDLYREGKKALKKATGAKLDEVLEIIESSPSKNEIDHAFIVFGVSLNVKDNMCKLYLYKFFQMIMAGSSSTDYSLWENDFLAAQAQQLAWTEWKEAQSNPTHPKYGTPEPLYIGVPAAPSSSVRLTSNRSGVDYDIRITWAGIQETAHVGKYKPDAKRNQVWVENNDGAVDSSSSFITKVMPKFDFFTNARSGTRITWQETNDSYRTITIRGLNYTNVVYKGKSVQISAYEAIEDRDESSFIIPLHSELYREVSLIAGTQMANACTFIVLNSWEVKKIKKKWYQTGIFMVILIIIIIVVSIFFPPFAATAGGVLGTNVAVGAAIGFAAGTTAALVAGAIANALAAILISRILSVVATKLFGEKFGMIIAAVASIAVMNVGGAMSAGQGWAANFGSMMSAPNLLMLTNSISQAYIHDVNIDTMKVAKETAAMIADYEKESDRIKDLFELNFGSGGGVDVRAITEMASRFEFRYESQDSFIGRTLMTGTDIANLSQDMIDNFVSMSTSLELT